MVYGGVLWEIVMLSHFFSGSHTSKVDEKNRFVLPHVLRYGLVENGILRFSLALGVGGCLSIYRKSDMEKMVEKFREKQHIAQYQRFFTVFFSTLYETECDKVGRITIPSFLKQAVSMEQDIVIAGVLNKIEIWPKSKYEENLKLVLEGVDGEFSQMSEEILSSIDTKQHQLPMEKTVLS